MICQRNLRKFEALNMKRVRAAQCKQTLSLFEAEDEQLQGFELVGLAVVYSSTPLQNKPFDLGSKT